MLKKILISLIAIGLLSVVAVSYAADLYDVGGHDNETAIQYLYDNGVISGYPDGSFRPDSVVNRAELLKILVGGTGVTPSVSQYNNCFPDVKDDWYAPFVCYAKSEGWVDGYPDGTFKPEQYVNKVEAIKMVVNSQEYYVPNTVSGYDTVLFDDIDMNEWYAPYLHTASQRGLLEEEGSFSPEALMRRGQISENIYRAMIIEAHGLYTFDDYRSDRVVSPYFENGDIDFGELTPFDATAIMAGKTDTIVNGYYEGFGNDEITQADKDYLLGLLNWYEAGTIKVEPYEGWKLLLLELQCDGMCFRSDVYRLAYNSETNELKYLVDYSDGADHDYLEVLIGNQDSDVSLSGLNPPQTVSVPGMDVTLELESAFADFNSATYIGEVAFTESKYGQLYFAPEQYGYGCLYFESPDGVISQYKYDIGLLDDSVVINWEEGGETNLSSNYSLTHRGCGIAGSCYFVDTIDESEIVLAGVTNDGVELYEVADPIEGYSENKDPEGISRKPQYLLDSYYQIYLRLNEDTSVTFDDYVDQKPLLYWQDPFGRWSSILLDDFMPAAECGKPVIYLYPEETTDVSVEVGISEMTVSIPDYNEGWKVKAYSDGTLYNYEDKQTYPYLFWEGHSDKELKVDKGFMVSKKELESFLTGSLKELGLNAQESDDFMEFWYPIMMDNSENYFYVTFVGTQDFNKIAPLAIEPCPDTLLRVFMYYEPVAAPYAVIPQELKGMERRGFTVVEWGGTSSRTWK
ncbi:hypothetical protein GF354_04635 [Candidatus Peregrinibacteria bacterium]|nr:hypothetical protein [Candidatus Peregrinibacteria bacterium]